MKIILQVVTAVAGLVLVVGIIALALWTQVLAATPLRSEPPTAEDLVQLRKSLPALADEPLAPANEPQFPCPLPAEPL